MPLAPPVTTATPCSANATGNFVSPHWSNLRTMWSHGQSIAPIGPASHRCANASADLPPPTAGTVIASGRHRRLVPDRMGAVAALPHIERHLADAGDEDGHAISGPERADA